MKRCHRCQVSKPLSAYHKHATRPDGVQSYCKKCISKNRRRHSDPANAEYMRWYFLKVKYGVNREQYEQLFVAQGGRCAICQAPAESVRRPGKTVTGLSAYGLCIDHDHETGVIRGLLCNQCNRAIGLMGDDARLLEAAWRYVSSSGSNLTPAYEPTRQRNRPRKRSSGLSCADPAA